MLLETFSALHSYELYKQGSCNERSKLFSNALQLCPVINDCISSSSVPGRKVLVSANVAVIGKFSQNLGLFIFCLMFCCQSVASIQSHNC